MKLLGKIGEEETLGPSGEYEPGGVWYVLQTMA